MVKKLFQIANEDGDNVAVDWVVLTAGIVSLGMAITLTATHHANAASPQVAALVSMATNAH